MTGITLFILVICGMCTNLMSALFGIGGGVLMVPVLRTLFPQVPIQIIAATSLTIVMSTAIINLFYFRRQKLTVDIKRILLWSLAMIVGVHIGFELSFIIPEWAVIGIFIITISSLAIKTMRFVESEEKEPDPSDLMQGIKYCLFGGGIAGVTGLGGGSVMAPLVNQLSSVKHYQVAVYTNYMMVFGGLGSLINYISRSVAIPESMHNSWMLGYVNFSVVLFVVAGSFVMSFFSMKIRKLLSPTRSNKILGYMLIGIALYMLGLQIII